MMCFWVYLVVILAMVIILVAVMVVRWWFDCGGGSDDGGGAMVLVDRFALWGFFKLLDMIVLHFQIFLGFWIW